MFSEKGTQKDTWATQICFDRKSKAIKLGREGRGYGSVKSWRKEGMHSEYDQSMPQ